MDKAPAIGTRVRYKGGLAVGPCSGVVHAIYPKEIYPDDFDWENEEGVPAPIGMAPERDWHVGMTVDLPLPEPFAYGHNGGRRFAPPVSDLELEEK